jgi:hypothetical protein
VDWVQLDSYTPSGTFTSSVIDVGQPANWATASWTASSPPGTTLTVQVAVGNTSTPDSTWSAWTTVTNGGALKGLTGRYLQYRVVLTTTNPLVSPALDDITFSWS